MSARDDGGMAFPQPDWANPTGMSLRDWYAGQALVGLLATESHAASRVSATSYQREVFAMGMASASYFFADAMLAARKGDGS